MRIRRRLTNQEAEHLNLEIKPKIDKEGRNPQYDLNEYQLEVLLEFRMDKYDEPTKPKGKDLLDVESHTTPNDYKPEEFILSAYDYELGKILTIEEYCNKYNMNYEDVTSYKFLPHHYKEPTYHIVFRENKLDVSELDYSFIDEIIQKHVEPIDVEVEPRDFDGEVFDRAVYTDVHTGMTPNENGYSLYGGDWDENVLDKRLEEFCGFIIQKQKSKTLVIDELGDLMDGWDGETTRKGHKLPQNMDNEKAFDVALSFKIKMIDILVNYYDEITCNNICEDNHAGAFGYVVNSAFKKFIEMKYPNKVKAVNHRKFINHYYIGKHCFVISHGKDSKSLKFGFKPHLDPKQIEKIDQYLKQNEIYRNAEYVEFSKGDSHQLILDYASSDDFDYCNYLAFSPSSEWVQTNFKKGRSGFVFYTIDYIKNEKELNIHYFK